MDWKLLAVITPLSFAVYQSLSKLVPKNTSVYLVNAYAAAVGVIIMLLLHVLFSANKTVAMPAKLLPTVIGIGVFIALGNLGIIKAFSLGASQSLFTPVFYIALIVYGILLGLLFWHESLAPMQIAGILIAVAGIVMTVVFRK